MQGDKKSTDMTIVSNQEFVANQEKYFDMALSEQIYIQKGRNRFTVNLANEYDEPNMTFEPDEDFYMSISMEEVREKLHRVIDNLYASK